MSAYELRILNESTGQYIPLAFIQGADGKDTFTEAQKKGYIGTEAEFYAMVATHAADGVIHVTEEERSAWDGKAAGIHASQHASGGSDPITPSAIGAAVGYRYTATIPATGWSESAPYTQQITVSGVTAAMTPVVDVVQSADADAAALQLEAWACVSRIVTGLNKITVYCYEKTPETNVPVQLVGVV